MRQLLHLKATPLNLRMSIAGSSLVQLALQHILGMGLTEASLVEAFGFEIQALKPEPCTSRAGSNSAA